MEIGMPAMLEGSFILTELTCLETGLNLNSVIVLSARISCSPFVSWFPWSSQASYVSRCKIDGIRS